MLLLYYYEIHACSNIVKTRVDGQAACAGLKAHANRVLYTEMCI